MIQIATALAVSIKREYSDTVGEGMAQLMIEPLYEKFGARFIAEMIIPKDYVNFTNPNARQLYQIEYMRKLNETEAHINHLMSFYPEPQDLFN